MDPPGPLSYKISSLYTVCYQKLQSYHQCMPYSSWVPYVAFNGQNAAAILLTPREEAQTADTAEHNGRLLRRVTL